MAGYKALSADVYPYRPDEIVMEDPPLLQAAVRNHKFFGSARGRTTAPHMRARMRYAGDAPVNSKNITHNMVKGDF